MPSKAAFRKHLSLPAMLAQARRSFQALPDQVSRCQTPLADHLMSGLALFGLKYPSLLQFDNDIRQDDSVRHNLRTFWETLYLSLNLTCKLKPVTIVINTS